MEGYLQPMHLVILFIIFIVIPFYFSWPAKILRWVRRRQSASANAATEVESRGAAPRAANETKYCMDCGQKILWRAELCPHCGCRQLPPP